MYQTKLKFSALHWDIRRICSHIGLLG